MEKSLILTKKSLLDLPSDLIKSYCQALQIYCAKSTNKEKLINKIIQLLDEKLQDFPCLLSIPITETSGTLVARVSENQSIGEVDFDTYTILLKRIQVLNDFLFLVDDKEKIQHYLGKKDILFLCKQFCCINLSNKRKEELSLALIDRIIYDVLPNYSDFQRLEEYLIQNSYRGSYLFYSNLGEGLLLPCASMQKDTGPSSAGEDEKKDAAHVSFDDDSELTSFLTLHHLPQKRSSSVTEYRQGLDLYSQQPIVDILDKEIDHFIEKQFISYSILSSSESSSSVNSAVYSPIKEIVNSLENLNLTSSAINSSKGQLWKDFIREEKISSYPRDLITIGFSETTCRNERVISKYLSNLVTVSKETFPKLLVEIQYLQPIDNHIPHVRMYEKISDRMEELWLKTGFKEYEKDGVSTRAMRRKYNKIK
jgi:hypothetical protein